MKRKLRVSIVICSYNGAAHLGQTLQAVRAQDYPIEKYELIVVDDGSADNTSDIAESYGARVIKHKNNLGRGAARNSGLYAARGEILVYTDDDCIPDPDWIDGLVAPYTDQSIMATGGRVFALSRLSPTERYMELSGYGNPAPYGIGRTRPLPHRFFRYIRQMARPLHLSLRNNESLEEVFTANASYRVDCLKQIGGFDKKLVTSEDSDVSVRLHAAFPDKRIVFAQDARVGTHYRVHFLPWLIQNYTRSQDTFVQIRKKRHFPPIYPFPVLVLFLGVIGAALSPLLGILIFVFSPGALYWWWQLRVGGGHYLDRIRFPYMQFLLESSTLLGYLKAVMTPQS